MKPANTLAMMIAAGPVLALFAAHQVRRSRAGRAPLVEPALFHMRAFSGGLVIGMAIGSLVSGAGRSAIPARQAGPAAPRALGMARPWWASAATRSPAVWGPSARSVLNMRGAVGRNMVAGSASLAMALW